MPEAPTRRRPGRPRTRKPDRRKIGPFAFSPELWERLDRYLADNPDATQRAVVEEAVDQFLTGAGEPPRP